TANPGTASPSEDDKAILGADPAGQDFYLAIRKTELGKNYFLSAYMKQYFPGAVAGGAARSMGTRVVSFRAQNQKLFVFDVDATKVSSDTFDPQVLVEAYPFVANAAFNARPHAQDYVLIDPSSGLNHFGVLGEAAA